MNTAHCVECEIENPTPDSILCRCCAEEDAIGGRFLEQQAIVDPPIRPNFLLRIADALRGAEQPTCDTGCNDDCKNCDGQECKPDPITGGRSIVIAFGPTAQAANPPYPRWDPVALEWIQPKP